MNQAQESQLIAKDVTSIKTCKNHCLNCAKKQSDKSTKRDCKPKEILNPMEQGTNEILIDKVTRLADIQQAFNNRYPFLKIEFFKSKQLSVNGRFTSVSSTLKVEDVASLYQPVQLNVDSKRTIAEVEKDCIDLLGLSIQVFRKSGNVWNEISLTESWTLESQNTAGQFISGEMAQA